MKKMLIVAFIVAAAVGACGGKKAAPAKAGDTPPAEGSAAETPTETPAETPAEGSGDAPAPAAE